MTNHDQENHWDLLASELGSEVPSRDTSRKESEAPREQPETSRNRREPESAQPQPPPTIPKRPTPRPPARPAPMGGGWDDLASQLGVVRPEQPDKPEPAVEPVQPESGRKQRDVEREWECPSTEPPREDEGAAKAPEAVMATPAEASNDSADVDSSSAVEGEQRGEKTKRRRRRRPAKKKDAGQKAATADESPSESQPAAAKSTEDEKKAEAAKPAGSAHRGIPSWHEAIETIISKNMESRAKKPSGSQTSRSRAGSRGGRKTKPTSKKAV